MPFFLQALIGIVLCLILPANGFLSRPVTNWMRETGNLSCAVNANENNAQDYNLCAIRVYTVVNAVDVESDVIVYDGIWYTNIFRQLINSRCTGFIGTADIGIGTCTRLPYENFVSMQLCICGTNNCNADINSCRASAEAFPEHASSNLLPSTPTQITCDSASLTALTCSSSIPYSRVVNQSACDSFARSNSVLCSIRVENRIEQIALTLTDYDRFLTMQLHELKRVFSLTTSVVLNETSSNIYVEYPGADGTGKQCLCQGTSLCNSGLETCAPQVFNGTTITTSTTLATSTTTTSTIGDYNTTTTTARREAVTTTESTVSSTVSITTTSTVVTEAGFTTTTTTTPASSIISSTTTTRAPEELTTTTAISTTTPAVGVTTTTTSTLPAGVTATTTTTIAIISTSTTTSAITSTTTTVRNADLTTTSSSTTSTASSTQTPITESSNSGSSANNALTIGLAVGIGGAVILLIGGIALAKFVIPKCIHACTDRSSAYAV